MHPNFGRNYPTLYRGIRPPERDRFFFYIGLGLAAFLSVMVVFVLSVRRPADAREVSSAGSQAAPAAVGTVLLWAADRPIRAGSRIGDVSLKEIYWPRDKVPSDAVRDLSEVRELYASVDIPERMPLQRSFVTQNPVGVTLPLTPGNRAVSIEVDATAGIEGFALPGTRVDVILTYQTEGDLKSGIIVQNAKVLSYGGDATPMERVPEERGRGSQREFKKTITLDVSPTDALKIANARELGRMSLMMRSADDNKGVPVMELNRNAVLGIDEKKPSKKNNCQSGSVRKDGREYIIGCDGQLQPVDAMEP